MNTIRVTKNGVYSKDPNKYPDDFKLIRTIRIDQQSGHIKSVDISGSNHNNIDLDVAGSSHEHDVTGGLETKLDSAIQIAKLGIKVQILRCCSTAAEHVLLNIEDNDLGTTIE